MSKSVLICGRLFDGLSDTLAGPSEILIENGVIADIAQAVGRPTSGTVVDLSDRTVMSGFYRYACSSLSGWTQSSTANSSMLRNQGADGTASCATVYALRLYNSSRYGNH